MKIIIELQSYLFDGAAITEFEQKCRENNIDVGIHIRENEIRQSALDHVINIIMLPETQSLVYAMLTSGLYDILKFNIVKLVRGTKPNKHCGSLKLSADGVQLIIEKNDLTDEMICKSLDVFREVAQAKINSGTSPRERMLNTSVVFTDEETGEVDVLSELDYIKKYKAKK